MDPSEMSRRDNSRKNKRKIQDTLGHSKGIPLAKLDLKPQDKVPPCAAGSDTPKCYGSSALANFPRLSLNGKFKPNHEYDFLLLRSHEVRWLDQTRWQATSEYRKAYQKYKKEKKMYDTFPYLGHESMLNDGERKQTKTDETSPVIFAGEFATDKNGRIVSWNAGSGHYRIFDMSKWRKKGEALARETQKNAARQFAKALGLEKTHFQVHSKAHMEYLNNLMFFHDDVADDMDDLYQQQSALGQLFDIYGDHDSSMDMVSFGDQQLPLPSNYDPYRAHDMNIAAFVAVAIFMCSVFVCCALGLGTYCGYVVGVVGKRILNKKYEETKSDHIMIV